MLTLGCYPPRRFPFAAVACGLMFGATVGGFGGGFSNDNLSSFCMFGFFGAKSGMPRGDFFFIALNLRLSQIVRPPICNHRDRDRYKAFPETRPPSSRSALQRPPPLIARQPPAHALVVRVEI